MKINFKLLGKTIKQVRKHSNLSQEDLAERVDVSPPYISMVETGKKQVSLQVLSDIADALGTTVDGLLTGNQVQDLQYYLKDYERLLSDCGRYEKQILYDMVCSMKQILRNNDELIERKDE